VKRTRLDHRYLPSPNVEPRRGGRLPDMLLLHYTGMDDAGKACAWLCAPESNVSCHYLVDEDGAITQMVDETLRAWHAGASSWKNETDINSLSIGIEIHNPGHFAGYPDFPAAQMRAVIALSQDIIARHDISPRRVLAHSDVAPGRKIDPGEKFDWALLHRAGVGHWVEPSSLTEGPVLMEGESGPSVEALQTMLALYGYGLDISGDFDPRTRAVVEAFQRHFRPARVDGIADPSTVDTLHRLLRAT
jgi:N-acetylmuramoyl-L-alanine amidase